MKKFVSSVLVIMMLFSYVAVFAEEPIRVQLNGEYIDFTDENGISVDPALINDRTMVPMRRIFEALGATVEWEDSTNTVTAVKEDTTIKLQIDNPVAQVVLEGEEQVKSITLDSAPVILNDRTMVPVRFIAESLNKQVGWDAANRTVIIIDYTYFAEKLKEKAPIFYDFVKSDFEKLTKGEMDSKFNMVIDYEDLDDKTNNETIKIAGNLNTIFSDLDIALKMSAKITGSGSIYEALKEVEKTSFSFHYIISSSTEEVYMQSSLFEEFLNGSKWIKATFDELEIKEMMKTLEASMRNQNSVDMEKVVVTFMELLIPSSSINVNTFAQLDEIANMLYTLVDGDNFKVSGATTKTYTWKVTKEDFVDLAVKMILKGDPSFVLTKELKEEIDRITFKIETNWKVKDNRVNASGTEFVFGYKDTKNYNEAIELQLKVESEVKNFNKDVKIELPKASNTISISDIQ